MNCNKEVSMLIIAFSLCPGAASQDAGAHFKQYHFYQMIQINCLYAVLPTYSV